MSGYKIYRIKYILSNQKAIIHEGKRGKIVAEWNELLELPLNKIMRKLKLHKDNTVELLEMHLVDWCGNSFANKIFK